MAVLWAFFMEKQKMKRLKALNEKRSGSEKKLYSEILGKLFDAQEDGETVIIKYKDQMIKGVISIVQVRNDTFEIETGDETVEGSIWDISKVEREMD